MFQWVCVSMAAFRSFIKCSSGRLRRYTPILLENRNLLFALEQIAQTLFAAMDNCQRYRLADCNFAGCSTKRKYEFPAQDLHMTVPSRMISL
jgi:hypothetical protein